MDGRFVQGVIQTEAVLQQDRQLEDPYFQISAEGSLDPDETAAGTVPPGLPSTATEIELNSPAMASSQSPLSRRLTIDGAGDPFSNYNVGFRSVEDMDMKPGDLESLSMRLQVAERLARESTVTRFRIPAQDRQGRTRKRVQKDGKGKDHEHKKDKDCETL